MQRKLGLIHIVKYPFWYQILYPNIVVKEIKPYDKKELFFNILIYFHIIFKCSFAVWNHLLYVQGVPKVTPPV